MTTKTESTFSKHIAGIIPTAKVITDIETLPHPSLLPIGNGFYNIQRAIVECAYAGCSTIWIVCEESYAPLMKRLCGDFVINMNDYERSKHTKHPSTNRRTVPIFYAPLSYKYQDKSGLGVSLIDGINASFHVSKTISSWLVPHKYYVASPYGVYDPEVKRSFVKTEGSLFLSSGGKTALDGENLAFCLNVEQAKHCSYLYKKNRSNSLFTLDKIIDNDIVRKNMTTHEVEKYHNIQNWQGYTDMWSSTIPIYPKYKFCFTSAFKKQERKLA